MCFAILFSILFIFTLSAFINFLLCKVACFSFLPLSVFGVTHHHVWSTNQISSVNSWSSSVLTDVHHIPVGGIPQSINGRTSKSVKKPAYLTVVSALNDWEKAAFSISAINKPLNGPTLHRSNVFSGFTKCVDLTAERCSVR